MDGCKYTTVDASLNNFETTCISKLTHTSAFDMARSSFITQNSLTYCFTIKIMILVKIIFNQSRHLFLFELNKRSPICF